MQLAIGSPPSLRAALRWWPEWPVAMLTLLSWVLLIAWALWPEANTGAHAGHGTNDHARHSFGTAFAAWGVMSAAMMLPVTLPAVRFLAFNSVRARRIRAMTLYVAGYLAVWLAFGAIALATERALTGYFAEEQHLLLAGALIGASLWQLSSIKRRALLRCHATVPLPPFGLRADVASARFATVHGWRCLQSCWTLMLVMAVIGHTGLVALGVMAAITVLLVLEELREDGTDVLVPSAAFLSLAAGLAASGVFSA
jgi:predicted metal-binding membrane protein